MKLYLVRHAHTDYNERGLCNADPAVPVHLDALGRQQAAELAIALKDEPLEALYASELPRTQETAEAIAVYHHLPLQIDARLNENKTGFEGQAVRLWYQAMEAHGDRWNYRHAEGESLQEVRQRNAVFLGDLALQPWRAALVVTHAINVRMLQLLLDPTPKDLWEYTVQQGGYTVVDFDTVRYTGSKQ